MPGQQFGYAFDDIGNRKSTKAGGDQTGANLRPASYTVNNLNQYSQRDVPGAFDVLGLGLGTATVTVNSQTPYRKGEYFRKELTVANTSIPVWQSVSVHLDGQSPDVTGNVFVPQTPEAFAYDLDGNLTQDGRWTYTWDAENRLVKMESHSGAPTGSKRRLEFAYDSKGRWIWKKVTSLDTGGGVLLEQKFVYDGWNLLAILSPSSQLLSSFVWGLDLSGSLQGAGGVGGLLAVTDHSSPVTCHFVAYDGNGNVAALVKATDGNVSASYEYGPFGELVRATGLMAKANPFRFSTKYQDDETDLLYYGYRFYNASAGRWLSRDPIGERGGMNVYEFANNASTIYVDSDGRLVGIIIVGGVAICGTYLFTPVPPEGNVPVDVAANIARGIVPKCHIVIYVGHYQKMPDPIMPESCTPLGCAYASVNSCWAGSVDNKIPLPPDPNSPEKPKYDPSVPQSGKTDVSRALAQALKELEQAKREAPNICKRGCCDKVSILISCLGLDPYTRTRFSHGGVCGTRVEIPCKGVK